MRGKKKELGYRGSKTDRESSGVNYDDHLVSEMLRPELHILSCRMLIPAVERFCLLNLPQSRLIELH